MAGYSKSELINWLNEGPRTMNWGAILAFNRTDTNTVLLQEYIERFSTGSYLPPVQGYIGDSSTVGQYITDYVMDYPRLSFEIADVEKEIPDARLAMRVVGGTQVTFADIPGGRQATRIEVVDPLNGPELTLKVHLVDAPTSITAGKVVMDLSRSSEFSLSYSDFVHEQQLGGEFFQQLFEKLEDSKRVMVISEIKKSDSTIKPGALKIRTQAAPGAKVRSAENYGDGAVVLLVAMEGESNGGNPDASFRYLIPNDSGKDYSATILLGNQYLLTSMANELLGRDYINFGEWTTKKGEGSAFWQMSPAGGHLAGGSYSFVYGPNGGDYSCVIDTPFQWTEVGAGDDLQFSIKNNAVDVRYVRTSPAKCTVARCWHGLSNGPYDAGLSASISAHVSRPYVLNPASQIIEPGSAVVDRPALTTDVAQDFSSHDYAVEAYRLRKSEYEAEKLDDLNEYVPKLVSYLPPVNTFVLHSLLFKNNHVVLDDMALPGDMAIFGRVGPSLTRFTLDPLQPLVGMGETLQFNTRPAGQTGLAWNVENILGYTGDAGTVSSSGLYTAPTRIDGAFIRVKVTASGGGNSSSALVSVVANDITVGPLIQTCDGGHKRTLSAGTKGSGALSWSLKTPANGGTLAPDGNGKQVYTAPSAVPDKSWIVDEIVVKNQLTNTTKSAWVMVVLATMALSVVPDTSVPLPAGQTKLKARAGVDDVPDDALTWEILAGSGSVNNGIYTQPAILAERFVLVMATFAPLPTMKLRGYVLLPLPMFDYPQSLARSLSFMAV